ncbi:hypothetical protein CYY_005981 [Polysphondylium violaceum]|uniref:BZIP domain-containing protein n=1 Tax=Polysphondylium violaceum TaxID=133409 RepID=A0A8J4Q1G6_9MYCE|nr:hypothetical protein CYY_005981 [Polysphondylium violaceum]
MMASTEWLIDTNQNNQQHVGHNILGFSSQWLNTTLGETTNNLNTSQKISKLSTGLDGTQSPSYFLNLSDANAVQLQHHQQMINNNSSNDYVYNSDDSFHNSSSASINNNISNLNDHFSNAPISPVPSYHSSAQSSPTQETQYIPSSPSASYTESSPVQHFQVANYNSLKQTMLVPDNNSNPDFNIIYNFVAQNNPIKPEDSLLIPLEQQQQQQHFISTQNQSYIPQPIFQQQQQQQPVQIMNTTPIQQQQQQQPIQDNNQDLQDYIEQPFSKDTFINQLKSMVPTFSEANFENYSSESQQSESSQESDYEIKDRNISKKKRGRADAEEEEIDISGVTVLNKDQVLKLTSKEIEEYVSKLKLNHALTAAEEKELKKQRRLVKNREYASQSRSRRKVYVENIEQKLQKSNTDNNSIKTQLQMMKEENKALKKQLYSITSTFKSNPSLAEAFGKIFQVGNTPTKAAASVTLFVFIFLFSFTLLMPTQPTFSPYNLQEKSFTKRNLLSLDMQEPTMYDSDSYLKIKEIVIQETKSCIDSMFGKLAIKEQELEERGKAMEKELLRASQQQTFALGSSSSSVVIESPTANIEQSVEKNQSCSPTSLICDSPPLSPLN